MNLGNEIYPDLQSILDAVGRVLPVSRLIEHRAVVAVSGGADSVALFRILLELVPTREGSSGQPFCVVHINHGLRGAASDRDAEFVQSLARAHDVPYQIRRLAVAEDRSGSRGSLEAVARRLRYQALQEICQLQGARYLLTAHTLDDHVETVLFRLLRGTGIEGLSGIPRVRELSPGLTLVRPLREVRRGQLIHLLQGWNQAYCDDESNLDCRHTRNRIRHRLMPFLESEFDWDVVRSIDRLSSIAEQNQAYLRQVADRLESCARIGRGDSIELDLATVTKSDRLIVQMFLQSLWMRRRWPLREMGREQWIALLDRVYSPQQESAILRLPGNIAFQKSCGVGVFWRIGEPSEPTTR